MRDNIQSFFGNVKQFQDLVEIDQLKILIQFGILIGEIMDRNVRVFIYQVQDFYVETKYTLETDDLISINSFSQLDGDEVTQRNILNFTFFDSK